jgi:hypothetical protein
MMRCDEQALMASRLHFLFEIVILPIPFVLAAGDRVSLQEDARRSGSIVEAETRCCDIRKERE